MRNWEGRSDRIHFSGLIFCYRFFCFPGCLSAIIADLSKVFHPVCHDFFAVRFDYFHQSSENMIRDPGSIIAKQRFPSGCYPYFCSIGNSFTLGNMYMDGFQRIAFFRPEVHSIRSDAKLLWQTICLPLERTQ